MTMLRFLTTGGAGLMGINLARHLRARDHRIAGFIRFSSTALHSILDHRPLAQGDRIVGVGPGGGSPREGTQAVLGRAGFRRRIVSIPTTSSNRTLRLFETPRLSPLYKWIYETAQRTALSACISRNRALATRWTKPTPTR